MKFTQTAISGVLIVESEVAKDERGSFARVFDTDEFFKAGLPDLFCQISIAHNEQAGTIRGLHFQRDPHAERKLVRCIKGAIYDVAVDLRKESPTFAKWVGIEIDAGSQRALYIPAGCAHGYQTLADDTDVEYFIADPYEPHSASGVHYADPSLAIPWPLAVTSLSQRDGQWPNLTV